jgi:23S rRNA (cytidine1920-2'-O)/16S rRNA (cytidine1409-2'-O)-methyltransferase
VVADVSFISLTLLLRPLIDVTASDGAPAAAGQAAVRGRAGTVSVPGGVVREERLRQAAVDGVRAVAADLGWAARATVPSRVVGESGNQEYFLLLAR